MKGTCSSLGAIAAAVFATTLGISYGWCATASAGISGVVQDDSGIPVPGATIIAQEIGQLTRDQLGHVTSRTPPFSATATSGPQGDFSLNGLPAGAYYLCAYPSAQGYVSNCQWNAKASPINLGAGTPLSGISLTLRKGSVLQIVALDSEGLLHPPTGPVPVPSGHYFFPSVTTAAGYFSAARLTADTAGQHTYSVTIPNGTTVQLFIDSDLNITDSLGHTVPLRTPSGITATGGSPLAPVTVSLSN